MPVKTQSVESFIESLDASRKLAMQKVRVAIQQNLPPGFDECIRKGVISYVVPLKTFPAGYHCNPKQPLALISLVSNKNAIVLHHMGLYGDAKLTSWFSTEYAKHCSHKIDMGMACVRFKYMNDIPYPLIAALCAKMSPAQWVERYELALNKTKGKAKP